MAQFQFTPSFGNRPSYLVGRDVVLEQILGGLDTPCGSKERAVVLTGQRGSGKTVLLWEIADRARERGFVVATPTIVREGLVGRIAEKLVDDAQRSDVASRTRLSGAGIGALGFSASLQFSNDNLQGSPEQRLTALCRKLTQRGIGTLLLVDELLANSPDVRLLVGTYQELVGEGLDVAIVLAGLPASVSRTLNDHVLTFLNRARKTELGPLRIGDVDVFFRRAFESEGIDISPRLRRKAARATEGSPYLMQLVGHYLVSYAMPGGVADEGILEEALMSARAEFQNDVCSTTLEALSPKDVEYLAAMASIGCPCRSAEVAKRLGVTPDYAQQYRRRLLQAGVISAPAHGLLDFAVPYLADYLRKEFAD